jgi:hypothetical protein
VTEVAAEAEDKKPVTRDASFQAISLHKKQNLRQYFRLTPPKKRHHVLLMIRVNAVV